MIRSKLMMGLMCVMAAATVALAGCAGTQAAYSAAKTPDDFAYVLTEHYAAIVHEVAGLKQSGKLTGAALTKAQDIDNKLNPVVLSLKGLAESYSSTKSASDAASLQAAIDKAVPLLADFLKLLKSVGGSTAMIERVQRDLDIIRPNPGLMA